MTFGYLITVIDTLRPLIPLAVWLGREGGANFSSASSLLRISNEARRTKERQRARKNIEKSNTTDDQSQQQLTSDIEVAIA